MKYIKLLLLLTLTITCKAQRDIYYERYYLVPKKDSIIFYIDTIKKKHPRSDWGVQGGPNYSWFAGGDANFKGTKYAILGIAAGIYDNIKLNKKWSLKPSLIYLHEGAKNPLEFYNSPDSKTNFSTYYLMLPVTVGYKIGFIQLNGGLYVSKLTGASNRETFGGGFSWKIKKWDYWQSWDYGLTCGVDLDLIGPLINVSYMLGFPDVRGASYNNLRYEGCKNSGVSVMLAVPFKMFKN